MHHRGIDHRGTHRVYADIARPCWAEAARVFWITAPLCSWSRANKAVVSAEDYTHCYLNQHNRWVIKGPRTVAHSHNGISAILPHWVSSGPSPSYSSHRASWHRPSLVDSNGMIIYECFCPVIESCLVLTNINQDMHSTRKLPLFVRRHVFSFSSSQLQISRFPGRVTLCLLGPFDNIVEHCFEFRKA